MKVLGLDLGVNSVGWALLENGRPVGLGTYVFPEASEREDGLFESYRRKRGQKRRQRRNLARKSGRRNRLLRLLADNGMLPADAKERTDFLCRHADNGRPCHPYALRKRGLDERLTLHEFGRCLYHFCRRRGYLSTADLMVKRLNLAPTERFVEMEFEPDHVVDEKEKQRRKAEGAMLNRISQVREMLETRKARTIGELHADVLDQGGWPTEDGKLAFPRGYNKQKEIEENGKKKKVPKNPNRDPLGLRVERQMLEEEFHLLWGKQATYHAILTPSLKAQAYNTIFYQRPLKSQKFLVGKCQFFPNRNRAHRALPISQRFTIVQTLVNQTLVDDDGEKRRLRPEEIAALADELQRVDALSWAEAKDIIGQSDKAFFLEEPQGTKRKAKTRSGRAKEDLKGDKTAAVMRKVIGDKWTTLSDQQKTDLITRLITAREFTNIAKGLKKDFGLNDDDLYAIATAKLPDGYLNLSEKAIKLLLPRMEHGRVYSEACEDVGLREPGKSTEDAPDQTLDKLPSVTNLRNPIVERSVNSAIKVINAIIKTHGKPDVIRIELPRDVSRTNKQRTELYQDQDRRAKEREAAKKLLADNKLPETEINIKKVRLWQEAGTCCPYEPGTHVSLQELIKDYDIDHIVPRSRCFEDGWHNLTICPNALNAEKGSATPFEAWGGTSKWPLIRTHVLGLRSMPKNKRDRILRETWEDVDFNARALTDTRYISREILTAVKQLGVDVTVSVGQLTALLRTVWEADTILPPSPEEREAAKKWWEAKQKKQNKTWNEQEEHKVTKEWLSEQKKQEKPRFDHRHHALDALITALTDRSTLQVMTRYFKELESGKARKTVPKPKPWDTFVEDIRRLIDDCPVVHQPTRGISGALHEETARKPPTEEEVDRAMAALPEKQRARIRNCLVVGKQLVWLDDQGKPYKAYDLGRPGSNHHCIIWESLTPNKRGEHVREITVVPMIEAARRATMGEQVFQKEREGFRYIMALCKNDIVEWIGDRPGLWRVSAIFKDDEGPFEITLSPPAAARKEMKRNIRVRAAANLHSIARRVVLDALGNEISSEPPL